jgi:oligopeptidase B
VTYWEAAKWLAKLRANNTGTNPVMLAINMSAGHAGQSGRYKSLEKIALVYAFAILAAGAAIEPLA